MTSKQDWRTRIKESRAWRPTQYVLSALFFAMLLEIFDWTLGSWLHELGHALTTWSIRATVIKIEWARTYVRTTYPWQMTIINFGGGLLAAFFLLLAYVLLTKKGKSIDIHKRMVRDAVFSLRIILLAGIIKQLVAAVLEGEFPAVYKAASGQSLVLFAVSLLCISASVIILMRRTKEHALEPHISTLKEPTARQQQ